ncbi:unnamed protein product [Effrenium voratum]|uniref:RRM domain-containing protein n=1 Tax=Effrenium voratum TaxID=2562239 RepID=A0AA36IL64_9DINO|nr:unnamed protein product [Effrenium voratum]
MLYELFTAQHIPVVTVRVVRDTKTFESQFHGYVNFHTFQDAEKALALDGARLCGQRCFLSWSSRARQSRKEPKDPRVAKPEPKRAALGPEPRAAVCKADREEAGSGPFNVYPKKTNQLLATDLGKPFGVNVPGV